MAIKSDRFWPLWISALQLTTSLGHLFKGIDSKLTPLAYAAALRFWSYPILVIVVIGVWRSQQRSITPTRGDLDTAVGPAKRL